VGNGKLIFFGTGDVGLPFLKALHPAFDIGMIITQPDSRGGRSRKPIIPAVKRFAQDNRIPFRQPEKLKDTDLIAAVSALQPKVAVVVAYGRLIPPELFSIPRHRTVNVHFSLLPLYRGAAPVQRAIENGESQTGITIFEIDRRLDAGDIWAQKEFAIQPDETAAALLRRLSGAGALFLVETLERIFSGKISRRVQDHARASDAPALKKSEGWIDWTWPASVIYDRFRAFTPWPGLCFRMNSRPVTVVSCRPLPPGNDSGLPLPGKVLALDRNGMQVECGSQSILAIEQIQPPGKKAMTPFQYSLGNRVPERLA